MREICFFAFCPSRKQRDNKRDEKKKKKNTAGDRTWGARVWGRGEGRRDVADGGCFRIFLVFPPVRSHRRHPIHDVTLGGIVSNSEQFIHFKRPFTSITL